MSQNKKEHAMHPRQALLALLLCPLLAFAQGPAENLQSIRYLAFSTTSHLLLHYNATIGTADPRYAEKYRDDLQQLSAQLQQIPSPELQKAGEDLKARITDLERQTGDDVDLYPIWINPILEAQASLDAMAQKLYQASPPTDTATQRLDSLTLNTQRLLLFYQTRAFGSLAVYIDELKQGAPENLDQAIEQDFATLHGSMPGEAQELAKLQRNYHYIRRHLLQQQGEFVPDSVAFYLEQISSGSQEIASRI
ncbi:hypothetical protein [Aquipseudomonas ullengensis]|uniref:Uncharacterized protein n=1 Tax=Aquipseudomonas ullengensis TaxID=2759166 RepID=A0A7W4LI33_9GAMM|nr:hypothetical protein [Pseudomonas ullengensis]MBB2493551.1 hypothetical protein [Pseudomonas ullengensis]